MSGTKKKGLMAKSEVENRQSEKKKLGKRRTKIIKAKNKS